MQVFQKWFLARSFQSSNLECQSLTGRLWKKFEWKRGFWALTSLSETFIGLVNQVNWVLLEILFSLSQPLFLNQCDQIGRFLKVLGNKLSSKVNQIFYDFLGYFDTNHFLCKNCYGYFSYVLDRIWPLLNSDIWSHSSSTLSHSLFLSFSLSLSHTHILIMSVL